MRTFIWAMLFLGGCYVQEMRGSPPGCETSECRQQRAWATLGQLAEAAVEYRRANGELPATLTALTGDAPLDPWGSPYALVRVGEHAALMSFGHGGAPGGTGADEDLLLVIDAAVAPAMQR